MFVCFKSITLSYVLSSVSHSEPYFMTGVLHLFLLVVEFEKVVTSGDRSRLNSQLVNNRFNSIFSSLEIWFYLYVNIRYICYFY